MKTFSSLNIIGRAAVIRGRLNKIVRAVRGKKQVRAAAQPCPGREGGVAASPRF